MSSNWTTIPVGDALEKIARQKKVMTSAYEDAGLIPIIDQGREYIAGFTSDAEQQYVGKLPLTIFGDHTRILKWVDRPFAVGADGTQLLRGDDRFDQRFFYYALKSVDLKHFGYERHFKYLKEKEIPLPDLPTQRKIAGILSAYDDLIENNLRRIKILEQMAQSLYREWFVHFRFPGHETAKFVDSALGQIPKGWEVKKLGQVAKIVMGLSPKGDTYNDQGDGIPLVNGPVEFSERFTKRIKWTTSPTKTCKAGDLVVCVRGSTTGKNVKSDGEYCLGRGVCSISSEYQSFVDQMFANELPTLLGMTSGSTFPSWTGPVIQSHPVISPPKALVSEFDRMALPMSDAIQNLAFKNDNLRRTRDLLLPKLITTT
jgi:type I restriction enzyme S subunit